MNTSGKLVITIDSFWIVVASQFLGSQSAKLRMGFIKEN